MDCILNTPDTDVAHARELAIGALMDTASSVWLRSSETEQMYFADFVRNRHRVTAGLPAIVERWSHTAPVPASTIDETCPDCAGRGVVPYVYPVMQDGGMFPAYGETPCRRCGGDGVPPPEPEPDVCEACNGRGWEMDRAQSESGAWIDVHIDCTAYGGSGIGQPDPGDGGSRGPDGYYPDDFEATPAGHNWR